MRLAPLALAVLLAATTLAACQSPPEMPALPAPDTAALEAEIERLVDEAMAASGDSIVTAVALRDPATGATLSMRGDRLYHAASTMKVPVMIELFRRAERGDFRLDDSVLVENRFASIVDGSEYAIEDDSDDAIYERLGTRQPIRDLTRDMIVVSSNLATNLLIGFVNADSVQATTERLGTTQMRTLRGVEDIKAYRQGLSNRTTADDLATLMRALMQGEAVSEEADAAMIDILLGQRFGDMIPAGLPDSADVAHKTGWITAIHHDAAIVYPAGYAAARSEAAAPEAAPYVLVVLNEGFTRSTDAQRLTAAIATAVNTALR
jgi:beta-lactamase class A